MANNRPIGIFDSGLGGLTVAKEIFSILPNESTIYIGDTARVPYGNRSSSTIIQFTSELISFLIKQDVKAIVVACATASSLALETVKQQFPQIPIFGVINPAAKTAAKTTKNHQIGIIGTRATIASKAFSKAIKVHNSQANISTQACPLFVPIIEEGITHGKILDSAIEFYLQKLPTSIDTLVLGCTHYPIITSKIQKYLPRTNLINPGKSVASSLKQNLEAKQLQSTNTKPTHVFYATDVTPNFKRIAEMFLGFQIEIKTHHLDH